MNHYNFATRIPVAMTEQSYYAFRRGIDAVQHIYTPGRDGQCFVAHDSAVSTGAGPCYEVEVEVYATDATSAISALQVLARPEGVEAWTDKRASSWHRSVAPRTMHEIRKQHRVPAGV